MEFSKRISTLQPSAIREILKVTQDPSVISFAAGNPSPLSFPSVEMAEIAKDIFENNYATALQYGISEGYAPLRELAKDRLMEKYNTGSEDDDLIIVSGGQQGIELAAKVFLNEGDTIISEVPSFVGALNAFRSYNVNLVGVPMESDGMDMNRLEMELKSQKNVKLVYVIPTFQNPSGRTMSLEKRKRLLELADKYNFLIIEDSPYFELRYSGEYVPTIKSLDKNQRVIYVGSYSKILSPGIRVGLVLAPKAITQKMVVAKQVSDVHTNLFFMMIVAEFLKRHDIDLHIQKIRALYKQKRDLMLSAIGQNFDRRVKVERPDGGLFLWCELPEGYDGAELCRLAGGYKVAAVPGVSFETDETRVSPGFRLNFSLPTEEQIKTGIELMAKAIKTYLG
jgi:2-aminoadipate transaminase